MLKRVLRTTACGAVVGGAIGGYMYRARLLDNKAVQAKDFNAQQDMDSIRAQLSALLKNEENALPPQFFRYTTCPFCGKVSTFLQYHKIQHQNVEVDPMFKTQIKGHGYGKVPQLKFRDGNILVDSDEIVEIITRCSPDPKWKEQLSCEEINKWRSFASNLLVKYLVINVNESMFEAWRGYNYIDRYETIPYANKLFLKVLGAPVMFMIARYKTLPFLQKEDGYDPTTTTPRLALENQLRRWVSDGLLNGKKKFQGGKTPNLADIEVYGVLQSVRGHRVYDEIIANVEGMNHWLKNMESKLN